MLLYRRDSLNLSTYRPTPLNPLHAKRSLLKTRPHLNPTPTLSPSKTPNPKRSLRNSPRTLRTSRLRLPDITLKSTVSFEENVFIGVKLKDIISSQDEEEKVKVGFYAKKGLCVSYREITLDQMTKKRIWLYRKAGRHENIVELLGSELIQDNNTPRVVLVVENTEAGNLEYLLEKFTKMPLVTIKNIIQKVLAALIHLHSKEIVHTDLSPNNIMIDSQGTYKLGGWFKNVQEFGDMIPGIHKLDDLTPYTPPEHILSADLEASSSYDIWQIGCLLLDFCDPRILKVSGKKTLEQRREDLSAGHFMKYLEEYPGDFVAVVKRCLQRNPKMRPKAAAILKMPFFAGDKL